MTLDRQIKPENELTVKDVESVMCASTEETVALYVVGHINKDRFAELIRERLKTEDLEFDDEYREAFNEAIRADADAIKHERWRDKEAPKGSMCDIIFERGADGKGSYPVTVFSMEQW